MDTKQTLFLFLKKKKVVEEVVGRGEGGRLLNRTVLFDDQGGDKQSESVAL